MLKKIILIVFTTAFILLVVRGVVCSEETSLKSATERVEALFGKAYTAYDCKSMRKMFIETKSRYYYVYVVHGDSNNKEVMEKIYAKRLEKFMKLNAKKLQHSKSTILVWCVKPVIKERNGVFYGEAIGFVVVFSSGFVYL